MRHGHSHHHQGDNQPDTSINLRIISSLWPYLMQVHNLRDWRTHLATLRDWKEEGRIRYIGITTSPLEGILRVEGPPAGQARPGTRPAARVECRNTRRFSMYGLRASSMTLGR